MKLDNSVKMANRYGLDIDFFEYDLTKAENGYKGKKVLTIDFANSCSIELSSEITWATGGRAHGKMIGFKNPHAGTWTISTQVVTMPVLALVTGEDAAKNDIKKVTFKDDATAKTRYFIVEGKTVWKGEDGTTYSETITAHKVAISTKYSVTYTGDGDPQSIDIPLELSANKDMDVVTIERDDNDAEEESDEEEGEG